MPAGDTGDTADALSESADDDPSSSSSSSLARPPDGGWGWMVVLGSFFAHLIADGCAFSFGVLYVELLSQFGESKAKTAWVGSLFVSVPLLAGPVAGAATDHFGCRWTAVAGGLLATVGFIASSFAGSIGALCLTFGVLSGFALSLVYVPAVVIVAQHFEKRRAFTTGLAVAGSGIGTFVLAPLMEWLLKTYGWRGALLILAGLMLNLVVCGALYRPPPTLKRRRRPCQLVAPPAGTDSLARRFAALLPAGMTSKSLGQIPMAPPPCRAGEKRAVQRRGDTPPWVRQVASPLDRRNVFYRGRLPASRTTGWVSCPNIDVAAPAPPAPPERQGRLRRRGATLLRALRRVLREMLDVSILRNRPFAIFCASNALLYAAYDVPYVYTPDAARQRGAVSVAAASLLVSVIGIATTVGQVAIGFCGDRPGVHVLHVYVVLTALAGVATAAVPLLPPGFTPFAAFCAVFGFTISANYALTTIILVALLGMDRLTNAYGIVMLGQGIANTVGPPLAGWISDLTGSYDLAFVIAGATIILSGLMLFLIPVVQRCSGAPQPNPARDACRDVSRGNGSLEPTKRADPVAPLGNGHSQPEEGKPGFVTEGEKGLGLERRTAHELANGCVSWRQADGSASLPTDSLLTMDMETVA